MSRRPPAGPSTVLSFDDIRSCALALPEVTETTHFRLPSVAVGKKVFAHVDRSGTHALLSVDRATAAAAAAADPDTFDEVWRNDHTIFVGVCADLSRVGPERLRELVELAWRNRAPERLLR